MESGKEDQDSIMMQQLQLTVGDTDLCDESVAADCQSMSSYCRIHADSLTLKMLTCRSSYPSLSYTRLSPNITLVFDQSFLLRSCDHNCTISMNTEQTAPNEHLGIWLSASGNRLWFSFSFLFVKQKQNKPVLSNIFDHLVAAQQAVKTTLII